MSNSKNVFLPQEKNQVDLEKELRRRQTPLMLSERSMLAIPMDKRKPQPYCSVCLARGRAHPRRQVRGLPYCPDHNREAIDRKQGNSGDKAAEIQNRVRLNLYAEEKRGFFITRQDKMNDVIKQTAVLAQENTVRGEQVDANTEEYMAAIRENKEMPSYYSDNISDDLDDIFGFVNEVPENVTVPQAGKRKKVPEECKIPVKIVEDKMEEEENSFAEVEVPLETKKKLEIRFNGGSDPKLYQMIAQLQDEKEKLVKEKQDLLDGITASETNFNTAMNQVRDKLQAEIKHKEDTILILKAGMPKDIQQVVEKNASLESQMLTFMKNLAKSFPEQFAIIKNELQKPENMSAKHVEDLVRIILCI